MADKNKFSNEISLLSKQDQEIGVLKLSKEILTEGLEFFKDNAVMDRMQLSELIRRSRSKTLSEIGV